MTIKISNKVLALVFVCMGAMSAEGMNVEGMPGEKMKQNPPLSAAYHGATDDYDAIDAPGGHVLMISPQHSALCHRIISDVKKAALQSNDSDMKPADVAILDCATIMLYMLEAKLNFAAVVQDSRVVDTLNSALNSGMCRAEGKLDIHLIKANGRGGWYAFIWPPSSK
ncbi:hypothetical protein FACS189449_00650 [Alphaproteobacteria bacterium]|nr:hypothetical protein FACS189449_00650 [Alphaproteobacteria bacterium]